MKYIKRVSSIKPLSGTVVDADNVVDRTANAPSLRLVDEKIENSNPVVNSTTLTDNTSKTYSGKVIDDKLATKQDALTAGSNISIQDGVISSTSSGVSFSSLVNTNYVIFESTTFTPGQTKSATYTCSKAGYYPINLGWTYTGDTVLQSIYISSASLGTCKVTYKAYNSDTYANRHGALTVHVLWAK